MLPQWATNSTTVLFGLCKHWGSVTVSGVISAEVGVTTQSEEAGPSRCPRRRLPRACHLSLRWSMEAISAAPPMFLSLSKPLAVGRRIHILPVRPPSKSSTGWPYLLIVPKLIFFFVVFLLMHSQPRILFLCILTIGTLSNPHSSV